MSEGADRELLSRYVQASPLSLREIGRRIGMTGTTVSNYMRGHDNKGAPTPIRTKPFALLSDLLGIPASELRDADRDDVVHALGQLEKLTGGRMTARMEKLRDELDALIAESRARGL